MPEYPNMFCVKYVNTTSIPQLLLGYTLTQAKTSSKTALLQNLQYRISTACRWYKVYESCWNLIIGKLLNKRLWIEFDGFARRIAQLVVIFLLRRLHSSRLPSAQLIVQCQIWETRAAGKICQYYRDGEVIQVAGLLASRLLIRIECTLRLFIHKYSHHLFLFLRARLLYYLTWSFECCPWVRYWGQLEIRSTCWPTENHVILLLHGLTSSHFRI